jgi:beta-mannosidase
MQILRPSTPTSQVCFFNYGDDPLTTFDTQTLSDNWQWKQKPKDSNADVFTGDDGWTGTSVPTDIFKDLLDAGKIDDPHIDQHEKTVQWVGEVDWVYRTRFIAGRVPEYGEKAVLAFDGLDTYASVYLNGTLILKTEVVSLISY